MNTNQVDYSFVLGVASALIGLCVMLPVWYAVKALWEMHHTKQLRRPWQKQ